MVLVLDALVFDFRPVRLCGPELEVGNLPFAAFSAFFFCWVVLISLTFLYSFTLIF